jgi:predicted acyl esterase
MDSRSICQSCAFAPKVSFISNISLLFLFFLMFSPALSGALPSDIVSQPVYNFQISNDWLTMKDGVKLSVTYFTPVSQKKGERFPVLLEMLPYRKDDYFYMRDYPLFSYFARRGYVVAKVDIRGTGSSDGKVPPREYSEAELTDAVEIIDQLSKAPWSNGNIGMWGISWGGFNAIQVAMRQPPALKAIMSSCSSDDLYHDDVHYIDGAFHIDWYELSIDSDLGLPRSPDYILDDAYFKNRFNAYPWFLTYLKQQKDGDFWRRHSLRWNYDAIRVPTFLLGGLLDGYRDSIPRMLENMNVPIKAEIGPYNHAWPDNGVPGPNYEWRYQLVRWWDYWLKGLDSGIMNEPRFTVFVREGHAPEAALKSTPGQFRCEEWPISRARRRSYYPAKNNRLLEQKGEPHRDSLKYIPDSGYPLGFWWGETTGDMRPADAGSLVYDSGILGEKIEIIGFPKVRLTVSADAPLAHWVVCLEDVFPDGKVSLVTGALKNSSQRDSRLKPQYLEPGQKYYLEFNLHFTTWTFQPGHRIRVKVNNSLFPMIWPTPYPMTTHLFLGEESTCMELPVIPYKTPVLPNFRAPEPREYRPDASEVENKGWPHEYRVIHDLLSETTTVEWKAEERFTIRENQYLITDSISYRTDKKNPADSGFVGESERDIRIGNRTIRLKTLVTVQSDEKHFFVVFTRRLWENGTLIREKEWKETIPRQFH